MCYDVSVSIELGRLEERFHAVLEKPERLQPIYHVSAFSYPLLPVITNREPGAIQLFQWGLIPFWVKDEAAARKLRLHTLNARAETLRIKPAFRTAIQRNRCLVLVDGFYEWRQVRGKKYPHYLYHGNHEPFALGGVWDTWTNRETGEIHHTFSVITTRANALLEKIHNTTKRMPVILRPEDEKEWLSPDVSATRIARMLAPYEDNRLYAYPVSKLITDRGQNNNVPAVSREYHYQELEGDRGGKILEKAGSK